VCSSDLAVAVTRPLSITIDTTEVPPIQTEVPNISLVKPDENRKSNINAKGDYPIGIRKNGVVTRLRVVVGEQVITYSDIPAEEPDALVNSFVITIPEKYLTSIGAGKHSYLNLEKICYIIIDNDMFRSTNPDFCREIYQTICKKNLNWPNKNEIMMLMYKKLY
jgi:hypothetical protein